MKTTVQDSFKNTSLILIYDPEHKFIHVDFIGIQTLSTLKVALEELLKMTRKHNCSKCLNDNTNLIGGWSFASNFIQDTWLPMLIKNGIKHLAHVFGPSKVNIRSIIEIDLDVPPGLDVMVFDAYKDAKEWLISR